MPGVAALALDGEALDPESDLLVRVGDQLLQEGELLLDLRILGAAAPAPACDSVSCAPFAIASSVSSSELRARSVFASARRLAASVSSAVCRASISLRLKPPKICPKSNPHHHMPPTIASSTSTTTARHGQGSRERTAIRGASMRKCLKN